MCTTKVAELGNRPYLTSCVSVSIQSVLERNVDYCPGIQFKSDLYSILRYFCSYAAKCTI